MCRGNSDFDATHIINSNWIYELPLGRGQWLAHDAPGWLNQIIGGWVFSGIMEWRTGFAFNAGTSAVPVTLLSNFTNVAQPVIVGSPSALQANVHADSKGNIQFFTDPTAAVAAFRSLHGGEVGNRNILRGPRFSNFDIGVLKNFRMPWKEGHFLQFRWESFNAFNHVSFLEPSARNITIAAPGTFGQITGERSTPRVMQFALRYNF